MRLPERKVPVELQPVDDFLLARRQQQLRLQRQAPEHHRRRRLDGELQHVLNEAVLDRDRDVDRAAVDARMRFDRSAGVDRRVLQLRVYLLEIGVTVRAVHDGVEIGLERDRRAADVESEIGSGRVAADVDLLETARKLPDRFQDPPDPVDRCEVRAVEAVMAAERRIARVPLDPGTERTLRRDLAGGDGIRQRRDERHGPVEADRLHFEVVDCPHLRILLRIIRDDDELRVPGGDVLDQHRARHRAGRLGARLLVVRRARRNGDDETFEIDGGEPPLMPEQAEDAAGDLEMADLDERRDIPLVLQPQLQVVAVDAQVRKRPDVEALQLDVGVHVVVQRRDQLLLQNRRARQQVQRDPERDERSPDDPDEPPHQLDVRAEHVPRSNRNATSGPVQLLYGTQTTDRHGRTRKNTDRRLMNLRRLSVVVLVAAVLLSAAASSSSTGAGQAAPSAADVDALVQRAMSAFEVPGIALAVVKDGRVVVAKGYGVRTLGDPAPVDAKTRFGIASNTKVFTATALGLLVEDGKLEWDGPVVRYLPWFQMWDPFVTRELTIRDLLVHRSGLG